MFCSSDPNKMSSAMPPSNIMMRKSPRTKSDVFTIDSKSLLQMSSKEALSLIDLRDQMRKQFSPQELDFFQYNYNLKMLDIRQLDRIYFQTSALPYFMSSMSGNHSGSKSSLTTKQNKGSKLSDSISLSGSHHSIQTDSEYLYEKTEDLKAKSRHSFPLENKENNQHNRSYDKGVFKHLNDNENTVEEASSSQCSEVEDFMYDVVFGDCGENQIYHVYKKSQAHIIEDIHNLILEKLKTNSLVTCPPKLRNKMVINISNRWYRAIITPWPPRIPGSILVKLVDVGRYIDVDKQNIHCYEIPSEICQKPLSFQIKVHSVTENVSVGCIATVEQLNNNKPVDVNVLQVIGFDDNGMSVITSSSTNDKITHDVPVTLNNPITVLMLSKDGDCNWVQDKKMLDVFVDWYEILEQNKSEFTQTPRCGDYCLKKYDDVWCRAVVRNENPLKIFYIDYGNEVVSNPKHLKPMPSLCLSHEPSAFKIKWANRKNENITFQYGEELDIIPVQALGDNTYLVLKQGESLTQEDWSYKDNLINTCGGSLVINRLQEVQVVDKTDEFIVGTASPNSNIDFYSNINDLGRKDKTHDIDYEDIKEKDYILVLDHNTQQWHRAQLINQKNSTFYLIDTGKTCNLPKRFKSLLPNFWDLPPKVVQVKINKSLLKLCEVKDTIEIVPLCISNTHTVASQLISSPQFALESPLPLPLNKDMRVHFANTDTVDSSISYFFLDIEAVISSIKKFDTLIKRCDLLQEVNVGDYCGVPQSNIYCRAKVLKVSGDKVTVFILDLGEIDIVSARECRELPNHIYAEPPCTVRTNPLDSVIHLESNMEVTILPIKEISRRLYSVKIID
ncbi:hypothetical protein M8J75_015122 [Diaphorina citri]|nr:hypothetical protein M8J75_015122 [Diaphorina citri]